MKTKILLLVMAAFVCSFNLSCTKTDETTPDASTTPTDTTPASDGSQTLAQLAGTGYYCVQDSGFGPAGIATLRILTIAADGTYSYQVRLSDSQAACATSTATGGHEIAVYSQSGTIAIVGAAGISTTGTKVTFTPSAGTLLIRAATYNAAIANDLAKSTNNTDGGCTPDPGFTTGTDSTHSIFGVSCPGFTSTYAYSAMNWPDGSTAWKNVIYVNNGTLVIGASTGQYILVPGGSNYPTSYTNSFLTWH